MPPALKTLKTLSLGLPPGVPSFANQGSGGGLAEGQTDYLEPEYRGPFEAWKANDNPSTSGQLLQSLQPVLNTALRSYVGTKVSPTMRARARLLALDSLKNYDPARAKIRTHLLSQMQGLRRMTARENQIISIPERVGLELGYVRDGEKVLGDRLGRDPTTVELADHLQMSPRRIAHVRQAKPGLAEGQAMRADDEGHEEVVLPGVAAESRKDLDHWYRFIYDDLSPQDKLIMEHSLGLFGRSILPKQDIARKLRITPGAVSQRAARIQQKLDARDEMGGLF
jgi:DNA-directed RNA polymerase specialized sigma subunit